MRERRASSAPPPLCLLHVWWARRPLMASRAATLARLLPAYPVAGEPDMQPWQEKFRRQSPTFPADKQWFAKLIGMPAPLIGSDPPLPPHPRPG